MLRVALALTVGVILFALWYWPHAVPCAPASPLPWLRC